MSGATDPIDHPNPFFYSFTSFLANHAQNQKSIKILFMFLILPFKADSEIRTHDGALQGDFSEQNRSWDDSGTTITES